MNEDKNSATMVTIKLKVSMCRDIIANSNITKAYIVSPCDSDVNTPLNGIHVFCTCIVHTLYVYSSMRHIINRQFL